MNAIVAASVVVALDARRDYASEMMQLEADLARAVRLRRAGTPVAEWTELDRAAFRAARRRDET